MRRRTNDLVLDIATGTAASANDDAIGILTVKIESDGRVVELDGALLEARGHDGRAVAPGALVVR